MTTRTTVGAQPATIVYPTIATTNRNPHRRTVGYAIGTIARTITITRKAS